MAIDQKVLKKVKKDTRLSNEEIVFPEYHSNSIAEIAFSPDGNLLASASYNDSLIMNIYFYTIERVFRQ